MSCFKKAVCTVSTLVLVAINCVLLAGGVLVVYGSLYADRSGWLDIVGSYWSGAEALFTALMVIGCVIIGLAVLGSVAAVCRWRTGLLIYASAVAIVLVAFTVLAIIAFVVRGKANDWRDQSYPANDDEASLKRGFDRGYCYAQGAYICNEMSVPEAALVFLPSYANSSLMSLFGTLKGVNAICDALPSSITGSQSVCKGCAAAKVVENFTSVFDWANDKCPRSASILLWCGTFLGQGGDEGDIAVGTAPYSKCRPAFLDLVSNSAMWLGIASLIVCGGALLVLVVSCVLRRRENREAKRYGAMAHTTDSPQGDGHGYDTPQTSAPYYGQQPAAAHTQQYGKV